MMQEQQESCQRRAIHRVAVGVLTALRPGQSSRGLWFQPVPYELVDRIYGQDLSGFEKRSIIASSIEAEGRVAIREESDIGLDPQGIAVDAGRTMLLGYSNDPPLFGIWFKTEAEGSPIATFPRDDEEAAHAAFRRRAPSSQSIDPPRQGTWIAPSSSSRGPESWDATTGERPSSAGAVLPAQVPAFQTGAVNGMAIASMVLGILWLYWLGSILALIFGYVALSQIKERNEGGRGMAIAGVVLGWVGTGVGLIVVIALIAASGSGS